MSNLSRQAAAPIASATGKRYGLQIRGRKQGGPMRKPEALVVLIVLALLGALAGKSLLVPLPSVRAFPAATEFNVHRAFARLTDLVGDSRPHPADTLEGDAVRERLLAHLTGMGLQPQV